MHPEIQKSRHRRQAGFTLVEVIVVAVIVAILAGVSVPLYLGYINNSRLNQATNAAGSVASFINACHNAGKASTTTTDATTSETVFTCTYEAGGANNPSLKVPSDITITVDETNGTVKASHKDDPTTESAAFSFTPSTPEE